MESPPTEITTIEKINKLPWSIGSNAANTVFVQFTFFGSVFVLFLNALGFNKSQLGFALSLIPFSGLLALFVARWVASFGLKRTYLTFFSLRSVVTAFIFLTPWIVATYDTQATLVYMTVIIVLFSLFRSVAVTASFPWIQEYVPNALRGRYSGTNNLVATVTGFIAVLVSGLVLNHTTNLNGYMILFGIALVFAVISIWAASKIPGGAPVAAQEQSISAITGMKQALGDKDFVRYLLGAGFITLATVPLTSFVPLFMQEQVGISSGSVVILQNGILLGGLVSTPLWGWAADRYGSRPVMLSGAFMWTILPICWLVMPRQSYPGLYVALVIAFMQGIANMAWVIGSQRLLFVSVVPPEKKTEYMALYFAWIGVAGGLSQLLGGQIVELSANVSGNFFFISLDPYTSLFILGVLLPIGSILLLKTVRSDTHVTVEEFVGLFLHGNPFLAMTSMVRYHFAKEERSVVALTGRLAETKSPLAIEELLQATIDPRFNVRMEAVIAIAHTKSDPRLTQTLVDILNGTEIALSATAAWALGRVGDQAAIEPLRQSLNSPFRTIQAYSARALGTLKDTASIPILIDALNNESTIGLQMAYASALGNLQAQAAAPYLLELLRTIENEGARLELGLSLARLVGDEGYFVNLVRQSRSEIGLGTITAQSLNNARKNLEKVMLPNNDAADFTGLLAGCADMLARDNIGEAMSLIRQIIPLLSPEQFIAPGWDILQTCADDMAAFGPDRVEYLLLILHIFNVGNG